MQEQEFERSYSGGMKQHMRSRTENIDSTLERELEEGEELLWSGQPTADSRNRVAPSLVFTILGIVFGTVGLILLFVGFILASTTEVVRPFLGLFIPGSVFAFLGLIYLIVGTFLKLPLKNTIYALTNQRIIVMTTGRNTIVDSYGPKDIGPITRIERSDGSGDVIFTPQKNAFGNSNYGNYNSTYNSSQNWNASSNKGKLIGVPGVKEVERLIRRTFRQNP